MAGPALTDVPDRYDVVFQLNNGTTYGFLLSDAVESSLPFRTHKAVYTYSPTFLERQNLSNSYGDNFQDFFLTGTQADFSLGEGQHFFKLSDADSQRRYWSGLNVDPMSIAGNVSLAVKVVRAAATVLSNACTAPWSQSATYLWMGADNTNLYGINKIGTVTSIGAHGAGNMRNIFGGLCSDQQSVYISGATSIRQWNGSAFSTFSSTPSDQIVFMNNILIGYQYSSDTLYTYDTSGTATAAFTWKNPDGTAKNNSGFGIPYMCQFGGQLYLLRGGPQYWELWIYDGSGVRMVAQFPPDFQAAGMCVSEGIVFVTGSSAVPNGVANSCTPEVYFYSNGSIGRLWKSPTTSQNQGLTQNGIVAYKTGVVFQDMNGNIIQYDIGQGGFFTLGNIGTTVLSTNLMLGDLFSSTFVNIVYSGSFPGYYIYGTSANYAATGNIQTSQYTFDNTLTKLFRAVKIDADIPANTTVDLLYQIDGAGGTYTSLQNGVSTSTEYTLPTNTTGQSISVMVRLNSGSPFSATPVLKHVYVRAAPMLQQFRNREYIFDLSGGYRETKGKTSYQCRDGTPYPYDGFTAAQNLTTVATQTIPFTVADRFGQFTAIADLQQNSAGYDGFAVYEERPGVFIARINLREV